MSAYYNEFDPKAAAWLRELIADGLIPPGEVDERDIRDVRPGELRPFRQCHFFAGIGGWPLALRRAGWGEDREVWTASAPCQPFSEAGARGGFTDERHLWPAVYHLADERRPPVFVGEQVASKDGLAWFDLVSSDMEAAGYAGGALDLCSAGFGAPNIRQRLYFVWLADADSPERAPRDILTGSAGEGGQGRSDALLGGTPSGLAITASERRDGWRAGEARSKLGALKRPERFRDVGGMGDAGRDGARPTARDGEGPQAAHGGAIGHLARRQPPARHTGEDGGAGPVNGFWRDADWIGCTDGKWRAVEPGTFPLASGIPGRVALLRGAGNAINVEVASGFIEAVMELIEQRVLAA